MNILFIDDTEQINRQYVGVGGVVFRDNSIPDLFAAFTYRKALHGIPPTEEIKWSPRRRTWISENLVRDKRISAYCDILDLVRLFNGRAIVAVVLT